MEKLKSNFSRDDFDSELGQFTNRLSKETKETLESRGVEILVPFLNNIVCYLPMDGASYREGLNDPNFPENRRRIIEFVDEYFLKEGWDFSSVDFRGLIKKKREELIKLYCALREMGFSRDEITS